MDFKANIGIIGAMDDEVREIISQLKDRNTETVSGIEFNTGTLYGKNVVIAKCGIGKVFAAICTEAMIIKYSPDLIINSGVGGALAGGLHPLDIVFADKLVQHDMDTSAIGDPVGLVSGINKVYFDTDPRAREILVAAAQDLSVSCGVGTIATGDQFISADTDKARRVEAVGAVECEMEGCAVAHTAFVNATPCAVIRAISDSADGEATMDYPTFLPLAVKVSTALTLALVEKY